MKSIKHLLFLIAGLTSFSLLSGCTTMNSEFDCGKKPGVSCESLDQVNDRVNRGEIGSSDSSGSHSLNAIASTELHDFDTPFPQEVGMEPGTPLRSSETVLRIWMAPYEDIQGNYHPESSFFTVVKPGHWIGEPVKEITP